MRTLLFALVCALVACAVVRADCPFEPPCGVYNDNAEACVDATEGICQYCPETNECIETVETCLPFDCPAYSADEAACLATGKCQFCESGACAIKGGDCPA